MLNQIKNYLILGLIIAVVSQGLYLIYLHNKKTDQQTGNNAVVLDKNTSTKITLQDNKLIAIHRKDNGDNDIKIINLPGGRKRAIIKINEDGIISTNNFSFTVLSLSPTVSIQCMPGVQPTLGLELCRLENFALHGNANIIGLSVSLTRDLPELRLYNSHIGLYYRYNYDGNTNVGFVFGVYL
jgi:hypothetical protein